MAHMELGAGKPTNKLRDFALLCAGLLIASLVVMRLDRGTNSPFGVLAVSASNATEEDVSSLVGDMPIQVVPTPVRLSLPVHRSELTEKAQLIASPQEGEPQAQARSRLLHAARLSDLLDDAFRQWLERDEPGRIVKLHLPAGTFIDSWRGLEVAETSDFEPTEHRDQLLLGLAEANVPLSCQIEMSRGSVTVRDLLRTSLREFHLNQEELSWTTAAFAHYLPPQSTWTNRFGERFDFDQVAEKLIGRSLATESCQGIHLVGALTCLLHCNRRYTILTPATEQKVEHYLRQRVAEAVASQLPDGSWPLRWSSTGFHGEKGDQFTARATFMLRVTVTGHLLEWFHYLPSELKPPDETAKHGYLWLWSQIKEMPRESLVKDFCPSSHAIRGLELAISSD